jgi:hypothetical protein
MSIEISIELHAHVVFLDLSKKVARLLLLLDTSWTALERRRSTQTQREGEGVENGRGDKGGGRTLFSILRGGSGRAVDIHSNLVDLTLYRREDHAIQLFLDLRQDSLRVVMTFYTSVSFLPIFTGEIKLTQLLDVNSTLFVHLQVSSMNKMPLHLFNQLYILHRILFQTSQQAMLSDRISASGRPSSVNVSAEVDERGKKPPRQSFVKKPLLCRPVIVAAPENLLREKDGVVAVGEHLAPHLRSDGAEALAG